MALFMLLRRLLSVGYLMTHPEVPWRLKLLPVIAVVYFVLPRDLFFDYRPFGFLDDFIIGSILFGTFTSKAQRYLNKEQRAKDEAVKVDFEVLDTDENGDGNSKGNKDGKDSGPSGQTDTDQGEAKEPPKEDLRS